MSVYAGGKLLVAEGCEKRLSSFRVDVTIMACQTGPDRGCLDHSGKERDC